MHDKMQANPKIKAQNITTTLAASRAFHQTPYGRHRETTTKAHQGLRKTRVFDPMAQGHDRLPPVCSKEPKIDHKNWCNVGLQILR
jgi:hypothetical protein